MTDSATTHNSSVGNGPIAWMAKHGVAPNLLMLFFIIGGLLISTVIRKEFLPPNDLPIIRVTVDYPGATPSEVRDSIAMPLEGALEDLDGVKEMSIGVTQGSARAYVTVAKGTSKQELYQDVQQSVDNITTFPTGIERPVIKTTRLPLETMEVILFGDIPAFELKKLGDKIKDQLVELPEVTKVDLDGNADEEMHIAIPQRVLQRYQLTLDDVATIIRNNALEQSAGSIKTEQGELLVTLDDRMYWAEEYAKIPLITNQQGVLVRLEDVATIKEGLADGGIEASFNNKPAIVYDIIRTESQTPLTVTQAVYANLDKMRATLPPGVELIVNMDLGKVYQQRVGLLLKNAAIGLILVLVLLSIFLEYRLAFWVTMGIPTAFLGAMLFLPTMDISINMISMFAFITSLGIVVDDAIIAGENIFANMQKGMTHLEAAVQGAKEVSVPLAFAILTNMVAFLPLYLLPGSFGKLFLAIPVVVVSCFLVSWIEALFILPNHLAHIKRKPLNAQKNLLERIQTKADAGLQWFIQQIYAPVLRACLKSPAITLAISTLILMIVMSWSFSGRMGFSMFPKLEGNIVDVKVKMASEASISKLREVRGFVVSNINQLVDEFSEQEDIYISRGIESYIEENEIRIELRMIEIEERQVTTTQFADALRKQVGQIPGVISLSIDSERGAGPPVKPPINVEIMSNNTDQLTAAAQAVANKLDQIQGVSNIVNDFTNGKPQWDIELTEKGRSLGLSANAVAMQVRAALYGSRAVRQQRDGSEVTVLVRLPEAERNNSLDIGQLMIRTNNTNYVPLDEIAHLKKDTAPSKITLKEGKQVITITADVKPRKRSSAIYTSLEKEVFSELQDQYPDVDFGFGGSRRDTSEYTQSMTINGIFALILIYVLLAIPFRSYIQPVLIMAVIPFGVAGAILGHIILGYGISVISIMGMVALAGVVVNDSLILIQYANTQRDEAGLSALEAIQKAGARRLRPILLTTITTFGGLAPMVFETSMQARFITPMAVSLGFGILFTTFVCLLVLPALYILVAKLQGVRGAI